MTRKPATLLLLSGVALVSGCHGGDLKEPVKAISEGETLYRHHCAACHDSGMDRPGTVSLATRYQGAEPGELVKRTNLTPDFIATVARQGMASMPPFRKTEIDDAQLAVLAQWLAAQGQGQVKPE